MTPRHPLVMAIVSRAASLYGCTAEDIFGKGRSQTVAEARKVSMYAARERLGWSYPELGRAFLRDHSSVMSAVESVKDLRVGSERVSQSVRVLMLSGGES